MLNAYNSITDLKTSLRNIQQKLGSEDGTPPPHLRSFLTSKAICGNDADNRDDVQPCRTLETYENSLVIKILSRTSECSDQFGFDLTKENFKQSAGLKAVKPLSTTFNAAIDGIFDVMNTGTNQRGAYFPDDNLLR